VRALPCAALGERKGASWTVNGSPNAASIQDADFGVLLGANNEFGSSGPIPHSRHTCCDCSGTPVVSWALGARGEITLPHGSQVRDDDSIGSMTMADGSDFCLTIVESGQLEVWTAPLTGGRHSVALFNRSPHPAPITATWAVLGLPAAARFSVLNVWKQETRIAQCQFVDPAVPAHGVSLLILSPENS
jgi:hypothetical protein